MARSSSELELHVDENAVWIKQKLRMPTLRHIPVRMCIFVMVVNSWNASYNLQRSVEFASSKRDGLRRK